MAPCAVTKPPESLIGQIMFREMFHIIAVTVPQFGSAEGNRMCIPVAWGHAGDPRSPRRRRTTRIPLESLASFAMSEL